MQAAVGGAAPLGWQYPSPQGLQIQDTQGDSGSRRGGGYRVLYVGKVSHFTRCYYAEVKVIYFLN